MSNSQRLQSIDILRGMTVAGMILVNNGYGESFEMLRHSKWNGMTPCDLVFPFFLFIMGVSCYLSLSKSNFTPSAPVLRRVMKRAFLLFALGLACNWADQAIDNGLFCFSQVRIWAVLQRIALCYLLVSLFALYANHRYVVPTIIGLLAVYTLLIVYGNGYSEDASVNILAQTDLKLFGYDHLYHKSPVDPEGLLGTISSVAHVLIGFWCGRLIKGNSSTERKALAIFAVGTVCVIAGYLLTYGLPLNKRIWSPSYVLVTCGLASLLLGLLVSLERRAVSSVECRVDSVEFATAIPSPNGTAAANSKLNTLNSTLTDAAANSKRYTLHSKLFTVFGVNALALYVCSEMLAVLFGHFGISDVIYNALHSVIIWDKWASLAYALTFVAINYAIGYVLWRNKIFIKL